MYHMFGKQSKYNVEPGLLIHSSQIIISSNMLRSESTSSSMSLCSQDVKYLRMNQLIVAQKIQPL